MQKFNDILKERVLVLDGAMGTMVQGYGLKEVDFRGSHFKEHPIDLMGNKLCSMIWLEQLPHRQV